jgi:hypothetical protein
MEKRILILIICVILLLIASIIGIVYAVKFEGTGAAKVATGNTPPSIQGKSAIQLGAFGFAGDPWGTASNFVAPDAQWIWNASTAATSAEANVPITFSNQWWNQTSNNVDAILHVIVDDTATVSLNGTKLRDVEGGGWNTTSYPQIPVTLTPGNNRIDIVATNSGGPAALLVALVRSSDKAVLLKSDSTWVTNE